MMSRKYFNYLGLLAFVLFLFTGLFYLRASALENCSESKLRDLGVAILNCTGDAPKCEPTTQAPTQTLPAGTSIYMLGDSLTVGAMGDLEAQIAQAGFTVAKINADGGRAISMDTYGSEPTGLQAVASDASIIASAGAIVIALGTNSGTEDLNAQIPALISAVKNTNPNAPIYWVNLFYDLASRNGRNSVIESNSGTSGYTVIDTVAANIELSSDKTHPTTGGSLTFAQAVVAGLQAQRSVNSQAASTIVSSGCTCELPASGSVFPPLNNSVTWGEGVWAAGSSVYQSGLSGPYTIEQWAIHVLKNISRKSGVPESTMVTKNKVIALIAWAKIEGGGVGGANGQFNPLNTKSVYSDVGGSLPSSTVDDNSADYDNFDDGVESITRSLFNRYQKRIGSALLSPAFAPDTLIQVKAGDFYSTNGSDVVNRLENIYPGEGPYAMASVTGYTNGMPSYWPVGDREKYIRSTSSSLEDILTDYASYAGRVLDGSPPGTPAPLVFDGSGTGGGASGGGGNCGGSGTVSLNGYAFPLAPQTQQINGITANQKTTTHHDGTAAFDLSYPGVEGAAVYAIYSGRIVNVRTQEADWCQSIQFKADDGFYYWYGHLIDVSVAEGDRVVAGQQIAEVADWTSEHTCNGTSSGAHLHIDRGCTLTIGNVRAPQPGGSDNCRDPDFVILLGELFATLPPSRENL